VQTVDSAVGTGPPFSDLVIIAGLYSNIMIFALVLLAATFTILLYPSGLLSPRWRPALWLGWGLFAFYLCLPLMIPTVSLAEAHPDALEIEVDNPLQIITAPDGLYDIALFLMAVLNVAAIVSALIRAWRARGVERLQMRLFAASVVLLLASLWPAQQLAINGHSLARYVLLAGAFALIPLSCGVAILRYHLYDIDRVIGRTTAYALVSGVLLSVYAAVVMTISRVLPDSSDLAVAVATLSAAALFRPVLSWARRLVARHFNREGFDADLIVEGFALSLRDEVNADGVHSHLISALQQTVQPQRVGLWLREPAS
jgi:hypothetical protein